MPKRDRPLPRTWHSFSQRVRRTPSKNSGKLRGQWLVSKKITFPIHFKILTNMQNQIILNIEYCQENNQNYLVATSPDIQGLVAEADTIDAAIEIAKDLILILLEIV